MFEGWFALRGLDDAMVLPSVVDLSGDGKRAGAEFAKFKVLVTKADGTTEVKTLSELNITEIDLTGDATQIELSDGSLITGAASLTRGDGTTGTVADAPLISEAMGYRIAGLVEMALAPKDSWTKSIFAPHNESRTTRNSERSRNFAFVLSHGSYRSKANILQTRCRRLLAGLSMVLFSLFRVRTDISLVIHPHRDTSIFKPLGIQHV